MVSRKTLPTRAARAAPTRSRYEPPDRRRGPVGRYERRGDERSLEHLPEPSLNARTAIVSIPSANPTDKGKRDDAIVNRRVDILETERSRVVHDGNGKPIRVISEAAYQAGRKLQGVLEMRNRIGPASAGSGSSMRGDQKASGMHERMAEVMDRTGGYLKWAQMALGMIDYRLALRILGDRMSYADCAALQGKSGERGISYIATRFRDGLELLAECSAARGRGAVRE